MHRFMIPVSPQLYATDLAKAMEMARADIAANARDLPEILKVILTAVCISSSTDLHVQWFVRKGF